MVKVIHTRFASLAMSMLAGCAQTPSLPVAGERYRCELGIEFTARFTDHAVALDTTRGYELLFRDAELSPNSSKANEYRNAHMSAEFKIGSNGKEALLRYPMLPLAVRCVLEH